MKHGASVCLVIHLEQKQHEYDPMLDAHQFLTRVGQGPAFEANFLMLFSQLLKILQDGVNLYAAAS